MEPLVTILAISYNQEHLVEATLNSIKLQTYTNLQLIIADDASTDNTQQVIQQWIDINWKDAIFIKQQKNLGITANLNTMLAHIKGNYIKQIGCDDVLLPETISTIINQFKKLPDDYAVIYGDMYRINEKGELIDEIGIIEKRNHPVYSGYVYKEMIQKPFITAASMIYKREVLDKIKGYNEKVYYEDHDFYLRAARHFKFYYLPEKIVKYRVHANSQINISSRIRYFTNVYNVYITNYDNRTEYKPLFNERLFFCIKNFYALKCRYTFRYALNVFFKSGNISMLKYMVASLTFIFTGKSR